MITITYKDLRNSDTYKRSYPVDSIPAAIRRLFAEKKSEDAEILSITESKVR